MAIGAKSLVLATCAALVAAGAAASRAQERSAAAPSAPIGEPVADQRVALQDGTTRLLSDDADRQALVVVARHPGCEASRALAPQLPALERQFGARRVAFLYVDVSGTGGDALAAEAKALSLAGRLAPDAEHRLALSVGLDHAAGVALLDPMRRVRWRGALERLPAALDALLAKERIEPDAAPQPGLALAFDPPPPAPPLEPLTWHGAIRSLTRTRCTACHRDGAAAPFALVEPDDFVGHATMVREVVAGRVMPPWYVDEACGPFRNDISLRPQERRDLLRWLQDGCPLGDAPASGEEPLPPLPSPGEWKLGPPDYVFENSYDYPVPASGVVPYVHLSSKFELPEDVWLRAVEVIPRQRQVVHHLALITEGMGSERGQLIDGYIPGKVPTTYPDGMAKFLPKGTRFGLSVHYTPNGTACKDRIRIGLYKATSPVKFQVSGAYLRARKFTIAPNAKDVPIVAEREMPFSCQLIRLVPHMHLRGKSMSIDLTLPDGTKRRPLALGFWHPDWQFAYDFVDPVDVPIGTTVRVTGVFDNSADNRFNPDPRKKVFEGSQIFNEMSEAIMEWIVPLGPDGKPVSPVPGMDVGDE